MPFRAKAVKPRALLVAVIFALLIAAVTMPQRALARPADSATLVAAVPLASEARGVVATYKVQDGDSLLGIADILAVDVDTLQDINGLSDPNAIQAGAVLTVPDMPTRAVRFGVASTTPAKVNSDAPSFVWPAIGPITTPFGVPGPMWVGGFHTGIDIGAPFGSPIVAAADGTVEAAELDQQHGYGNYVLIDHGNGYETLYAHQSHMAVDAGQSVKQGQVIGYVGMTGFATGPHLHFEVRHNGTKIDPQPLLP
jgi:murein DD-endopeptidase MepM/ murein hydrolase activator NlpD